MSAAIEWPTITRECRPWAYWWWMGNAVNRPELTRHLETYRKAGMGGVHIVTIYGAKGCEDQYIDFLSPKWMGLLAHTVSEADRLDMGVDMTPGSKWPYGGPWVKDEDSPMRVLFQEYQVAAGGRVEQPIRRKDVKGAHAQLQCLMAFSSDGRIVDLTDRVDRSGRLDWTAPKTPSENWTLYAVFQGRTYRSVRAASPAAGGNAIDFFDQGSVKRYLARYDEAFADYRGKMVRAFYNDSYELPRANWTDRFFDEFQRRRGYDLRRHLPALRGKADAELVTRVQSDYRETVSDLLLDRFTLPWAKWAHGKGALTRNQAHGTPANALDLYAASDIPATETFGTGWLDRVGETPLAGSPRSYGGSDFLTLKLASSAAHVAGRPRTACEVCTCLGEHFRVPLRHAKAEMDLVLTAGINHFFYHGMTYSPSDADWPGWIFYAATNFSPSNTFWRDLPALNAYVARCQSFLQAGQPDNDVLLYFPIYDLWATRSDLQSMLHRLVIHVKGTRWLNDHMQDFSVAASSLLDRGIDFDFVSDRQLRGGIKVRDGLLIGADSSYKALVVAGCRWMPPETLERIATLAREGATVIVLGDLPFDVPGLGDLENRQARLGKVRAELGSGGRIGRGRLIRSDDLLSAIDRAGIRREVVTDYGVRLVRRKNDNGWTYFVINQMDRRLDGWVPLSVEAASVVVFDPLHERRGLGAVQPARSGRTKVYLQLDRGESLVLRALRDSVKGPAWVYSTPSGQPRRLSGLWQVAFVDGGPSLPESIEMRELASWTNCLGKNDSDEQLAARRAFSGTARYEIDFSKTADTADAWVLDLGQVADSARVTLNGQRLGTLFARPFCISLDGALRDGENHLEVEVTNLMANRIIDMERRGIPWCKYYFVYIHSGRFDRSGKLPSWKPFDSGLLGPVRLVPMATTTRPAG
ncbi:MAG: hypothetical protein JW888_17585 [Pirellulales bacterium]|nr:hypothetical protein [Pirellulales bacterium]